MQPKFVDMSSPGDLFYLCRTVGRGVSDRLVKKQGASGRGCSGREVGLIWAILKLTEDGPEPYGILYVLLVPRGAEPGRYQLREWLDQSSLVAYLNRYRAYFEGDGRHHLWVNCDDQSLIVYDRHETLHLYGDLDRFCGVLESLGYAAGDVRTDFPHAHHFNSEFDDDQFSIVNSDDYIRYDLVPNQDIEALRSKDQFQLVLR